jgi:hypothetical protein
MANEKEKKKLELRPVDEAADQAQRILRLDADNVEEVEVELPPVRVGEGFSPEAKEEAGTAKAVMARSNEPDIGSLIEREEIVPDGEWESTPTHRTKLPWGWVALVGCIFAGGILWSLVAVKHSDKKQDLLAGQSGRIIENSQQEERDAENMIAGIEAGVRGFFGSGSVEEMLRFVRHPQRIAPLMEEYYRENPPTPVRMEKIQSLAPLTVDNLATFWIATCELENSQVAQVWVEAVGTNEAKVDWETYVNYQPMDWDNFARSRPGGYTGDFRVYVEPDNFYSHEFADSRVFSSFRLTALKGEEVLSGYTPRGGALEKKLIEIIARNGGGATPVILRLRLPDGLDSKRGVVMDELICPRWVFLENPEKEDP